jgi:hypothetical protein
MSPASDFMTAQPTIRAGEAVIVLGFEFADFTAKEMQHSRTLILSPTETAVSHNHIGASVQLILSKLGIMAQLNSATHPLLRTLQDRIILCTEPREMRTILSHTVFPRIEAEHQSAFQHITIPSSCVRGEQWLPRPLLRYPVTFLPYLENTDLPMTTSALWQVTSSIAQFAEAAEQVRTNGRVLRRIRFKFYGIQFENLSHLICALLLLNPKVSSDVLVEIAQEAMGTVNVSNVYSTRRELLLKLAQRGHSIAP